MMQVQCNDLSITDTSGITKTVPYMEESIIQRLSNTVKYYCGMRTSVLNREMSIYSVSFIERFHCTGIVAEWCIFVSHHNLQALAEQEHGKDNKVNMKLCFKKCMYVLAMLGGSVRPVVADWRNPEMEMVWKACLLAISIYSDLFHNKTVIHNVIKL